MLYKMYNFNQLIGSQYPIVYELNVIMLLGLEALSFLLLYSLLTTMCYVSLCYSKSRPFDMFYVSVLLDGLIRLKV